MPTTYAIKNGRTVFTPTLYTGNGSTQTINNTASGTSGFKPDLVWIKDRTSITNNELTDSVRGATYEMQSNSTNAQSANPNGLTAFTSTGFSVGNDTSYNNNGDSIVAWQWQAGQGTTSSNTNGSITSTVSVNQAAGFSIVRWTGTGANATVGHGLGAVPAMMIVKPSITGIATNWPVYHTSTGNTGNLFLNALNSVFTDATAWNNTSPTSTVFSVGANNSTNQSGATQIAYCWAPVPGYSAFGSYTGNGSTNGPFIHTGFRPAYLLIKCASFNAPWNVYDSSRNTYNITNNYLIPNTTDVEVAGASPNDVYYFLSNGIKLICSNAAANASGQTYIYAAFAECPFKYANAR